MKKLISIRLDEELINEVDRMANADNRTRSNMIEVMLEDSVSNNFMGIDALIARIRECKTMGELLFVEDLFVKGKYAGTEKIDLETECLKKFQELK